MKQYNTQKRQALLSYLMENTDYPLSAGDIYLGVKEDNLISASAVYRNLAKMADDGVIQKLLSEDGKTVLYRYSEPQKCSLHLHMKCSKCGKVLHMSQNVSDSLLEFVKKESSFNIDIQSTVLYGVCESCK
ncbi:MAG: transcriptional repressor [Clostridiaceae bacterium]|nr:transcriptional repressor [Clostridiaceae bacterium]